MSTARTTRARTAAARPRRIVPLSLLALLIAASLQLLNPAFRAPLRPAPPVGAHAGATAFPFTEVNPYGANTFLSKEVEDWKRDKTLQMMSEAGLGWVKQQFPWSEIEPKRGRYWDDKYNQNSWEKYDRIVALSEKHGLRIIARLDNTPDWARGPNTNNQTPPTDPDAYANFVATFVEHYKGRIQYLQIWNEPNLKDEWGGKLDAAAYADLLRRTYARAKAVDPNIVILSAPLAQTLETGDKGLNELVYLQQLYDAGLRGNYDIMLANGYGFDQPPAAEPGERVLNLRRVELLRAVMERNGDAAKPVWLNEYGWNAAPADLPAKPLWGRVTPEQQAAYTVEGIRYARQHWPWIGVINIWFFRQVGDIPPDDPTYYFRIVEPDWATTPLFRALQQVTAEQRRALPGRYGPLSPAVVNRGRWNAILRPEGGDATRLALHSSHLYDQLTVQFEGNRLTLEGLRGPAGGRLGVTIDDSTEALGHLPRDERGRRYIDFRADAAGPTSVTVVSGLDAMGGQPREHTATLTVLPKGEGQGTGEIALTAIEVGYARSPLPFAVVTATTTVLLLGALALAARAVGRLRRSRADGRGDA